MQKIIIFLSLIALGNCLPTDLAVQQESIESRVDIGADVLEALISSLVEQGIAGLIDMIGKRDVDQDWSDLEARIVISTVIATAAISSIVSIGVQGTVSAISNAIDLQGQINNISESIQGAIGKY